MLSTRHNPSRPEDAAREAQAPSVIHALFEARATERPDAPALRFRGETVAYGELDARANRLAHRLRALGVGPEVPVGVLLPRAPDLVVALLAVLKAGGAYVPLDPAYPRERVAYMLADTRVPVLVTTAELAERFDGYAGTTVRIDAEREAIDALPDSSPDVDVDPANLAYLIYTSGSTGRPKGVQIEHRNTVAVLRWLKDAVSDQERSAVLASTSVCFDVSVAEVFGTLCWGGTLVLVDTALGLAAIRDGVRTACMVPSAAAELLRMGAIPACVRTLALGGEPLRNELAQRLYALGHVDRVLNLYGPTEDTTYSTCKVVERGRTAAMSVGLPVGGTEARVLDAAMRPVADGEPGEVWMAGEGVTRGYLGAPAMTADRYRPDPASAVPGARMYRTGDLGRRLPDGDLDCLGRIDHQVKVRGFRVEPGEIETALLAHAAVCDAVVTPWDDRGETRLAAYVVADDDAPATAELRAHLRGRLPDYMVPDAFVLLPELPRTPNGKVDRLALPTPERRRGASAEYAAPSTPVEARLAAIWAEVLGIDAVGVRDDFFELGGHSLLATQLAARVRERMGAELPLGTLFAMPTIEELARQIYVVAAPSAGTAIPRAPRDRPLPLSFPQEAIWFFQRLSPEMRSYNFQATVRVRGALDVPVLERALAEIVRRHEIFRTTFPEVDGAPVQVVRDPWPVRLPFTDLSDRSAEERETELKRRLRAEFLRPFDLESLPLVRWSLFRTAVDEHVLLVVEQHLVHDGWSFGVFLRELKALYDAFLRGEPSPLPELPVQFGDFAAWQRERARSPEAREQLEWWTRRLQGVPPVLELPSDRPRPAVLSFRGSAHRVHLPAGLFAKADAFSRRKGVTLFMTLFAAFEALLHRYTGETDFCVGSGVAGRKMRESEDLIGMIVNTLPIRADLSGDPTFDALVERVRSAAVETYARGDVPFAEIVAAAHPERSRGHLPVFQVAFSFHHAPYPELRLGDAAIEVEEGLGNESAKFDLNVIVIPRAHQHAGDEIVMIWEFAEDLFDASTVSRMIGHYAALLDAALDAPAARVSRLSILPADEERRIVARAAGAETPYPRDATLPALFAEQARRRPDATAIRHDGRTVTYAQLDAASDRVARRLRALGVAAEARVGVAMDRSPQMVASILGVLKSGGAYVPLDPAYPADRLSFMVADSGASVLIVDRDLPPSLAAHAGPVLPVHGILDESSEDDSDRPLSTTGWGESIAYVVYTSGSTGWPKGSGITHRGIIRVCRDTDFISLSSDERVAQCSTASFDVAAWEIWAPLLNGATMVIIDRDDVVSHSALASRIREEGVTTLFLTTALFHQVAADAPETFAGLRDLLIGGEAADPTAARRAISAMGRGRLLNLYGPSESATYASWHHVDRIEEGAKTIPIGLPVAHTTLYVLDAAMRPVPDGVPGELYVGGDGLSRGYLGRPGLTASRFVPHPFSAEPGERLYRTGDRVRRLPSGALEFLGRLDDQVKVRGFRVEPGEVEAALHAHPAVAEAAVVVRRDSAGVASLVAYVVGPHGTDPGPAEVRDFLAARLPAYMLPAAIVPLPAIPLTPGGKVDRRALPEPAPSAESASSALPETPTERALADIWREVLEVEHVGADDDFFALGGHSLRAARVASRIEARLGAHVPLGALFDHPTVRSLARVVDDARHAAAPSDEDLLVLLEGMSDEEAERLLARMQE